jgi:uncharacterized membrane protein YhhN
MVSIAGTSRTYAAWLSRFWLAAATAGAGYGIFLVVAALRLPAGAELTGLFPGQPAVKALMAVLLAGAAWCVSGPYPVLRERRWLLAALLFSAAGDFLLAIPWWAPSFVRGLGAFLIAHLCYLAALWPLAAPSRLRLAAAAATCAACAALLVWFWPSLLAAGLTIPVTVYIAVLGAMVCAALLARLPTPWTALGALCFAVSDAMIGIGRFVLDETNAEALAVPIWWAYAISQVLITAGFFFGRASSDGSDHSDTPAL